MIKRKSWMKLRAIVIDNGQKGVITHLELNIINGIEYVYYITVKVFGESYSGKYHPADI